MADRFSHCLFPLFTRQLLAELESGRSINLVGQRAQGTGRLLDDLEPLAPAHISLLRLNMHDQRQSHAALIDGLWHQAKARGITRAEAKQPDSLTSWCDTLLDEVRVWLLLDRFDTLLDDPERDSRYHCRFFRDEINSLRNRPQILLLTQTAKPHNRYSIHCGAGEPTLSPPDLQCHVLPRLSEPDARAEVRRRVPHLPLQEQVQLADSIHREQGGYRLLDYYLQRLAQGVDAELPLAQRIKRWRREADDILPALNLGSLNRLRRWLKQLLRQLGFALTDLFKEVSALNKVLEMWRRWTKSRRQTQGRETDEGNSGDEQ